MFTLPNCSPKRHRHRVFSSAVWPGSVSCSRSSNRTGGVTASGSRKRLTMLRVMPSATLSEHNFWGGQTHRQSPCPSLLVASVSNWGRFGSDGEVAKTLTALNVSLRHLVPAEGSFVAQSPHRIDSGGPHRRQVTGQCCHCKHDGAHSNVRQRVRRADSEQKAGEHSREQKSQS